MSAYPIQQRPPTPRTPSEPLVSCRLPLEGCAEIVLDDLAPAKWTAQSTASPTRISGYMRPTDAERSPYWAIDLGHPMALERLEAWIVPTTGIATLRVFAYTMPTLGEGAPLSTLVYEQRLSELPIADDGSRFLDLETFAVARFVRFELQSESPVVLELLGARIYGVPIYAETLFATYARAFTLFANRPLFAARSTPGSGPFEVTHTYRDLWLAGRRLARSFAFHLERDEARTERLFVGLALPNGPEWLIGELAALFRGYVVVPLSPEEPAGRLLAIVSKCPLDVVLCTKAQAATYSSFTKDMPSLRLIVVSETPPETVPSARSLADLLDEAPPEVPPPAPRDADDLHTLLFTSGSTGTPKGAMRSYRKFAALIATQGAPQPAVHLSFQPLSHASERHYLPTLLANGALIGIGAGGTHLLSDLLALEPTWVSSVPRLFDVVRAGFERKLAARKAAHPSADSSHLEDELLRETREIFGKNIQGVSTGSAPVSPETLRFMKRCFADLWVFDGYGSTEVGTIAANERIPAGIEVKLGPVAGLPDSGERGEILVRSPHVIDGYFGDGEASARAVTKDGFFHTGDLGERTAGGGVRVVGRIASTRKLGQGELVCVDRIEADLGSAPIVDRIFVHPTPSSTALAAVVVPHGEVLADVLEAKGTLHELCAHAEAPHVVLEALRAHGKRTGLLAHELPSFVVLEADPFSTMNGLLTPSGKLARREAAARYEPRFAELGETDPAPDLDVDGSSPLEHAVAIASAVTRRRVNPDEPMGDRIGQDSLATAEILARLSDSLGVPVPLDLWFRASTLRELAALLESGTRPMNDTAQRAAVDLELPLLDPTNLPKSAFPARTILLTGATGLLGAHLVESLVRGTEAHVLCLTRAQSDAEGTARIQRTLAYYGIVGLDPLRFSGVAGDLTEPELGLDEAAFSRLSDSADAIVHAGADVNWLKPYASVRLANVLGTTTLLRLSSSRTKKPFHYVSTISTAPTYGDESTVLDQKEALKGSGYSLSKWVAEALVRRSARLGLPVAVHRPGMITGHHERARGNRDDFVNRYLRACMRYGLALDRPERLDMTPVDYVSQAIAASVTSGLSPSTPTTTHLCNMHASPDYRTIARAIAHAGVECRTVDYATFRTKAVLPSDSPLRALASYFPASGFVMGTAPPRGSDAHEPWPSERTRDWLAARGIVCPVADTKLVERYVLVLAAG